MLGEKVVSIEIGFIGLSSDKWSGPRIPALARKLA